MFQRGSGILLHPTSLPGPHGLGDLGPSAYQFVEFLVSARQRLWQVLPLGPTGPENSPYDGRSSFAGSPLLVAPEPLIELGLLRRDEVPAPAVESETRADYDAARRRKGALFHLAFERFQRGTNSQLVHEFGAFVERERVWLDDFAVYQALHEAHNGKAWSTWEDGLRRREEAALARAREALASEITYHQFLQFLFERQWIALKRHANERGIRIVGDIPIYVAYDSADVWAHQELFNLDAHGRPVVVAGVPPDYFSETGQLWGNPVYRWEVMAARGYAWWIQRFRRVLHLTDIVRVDHFRAFRAGWQVPAGEKTAVRGEWVPGPGVDLFRQVRGALGEVPIIVEDLGTITPDVHALREELGYPGMKVLQFAFGGGNDNPYLPHNYEPLAVVYTGTHDNDTTLGWFRTCQPHERQHVLRYLGRDGSDIVWDLIRLAMGSVACLAIVPLQDVLELGSEARMNQPGVAGGNWRWRFRAGDLLPHHAERLADLALLYARA